MPHYFLASLDDLNDAETKYMKVKPPIRNELQRKRILEFVKGAILMFWAVIMPIYIRGERCNRYLESSIGVTLLELSLPLMLDQVAKGVLTINTMAKITSEGRQEYLASGRKKEQLQKVLMRISFW